MRRCHGGPGKFTHPTKFAGIFDRCPQAWLNSEARTEFVIYSDYRWFVDHGVMPSQGGKLDQSPFFIEAVGLISHEAAEIQRKAQNSG